MMKTIAFVIPWYGDSIPGGAEALCREYVKQITQKDNKVIVLSTCVKDHHSNWNEDYYEPGDYKEGGIPIKRFPVRKGNHHIFNNINDKFISRAHLSVKEERLWMQEGINSDDLYAYIADNKDKYIYVFLPYLFGTSYYGMQACDCEGYLLGALHDEGYAHSRITRHLYENAKGLIYNSIAEKDFAESIFDINGKKSTVLGVGINLAIKGDAGAFRDKYNINSPFILYAGRKDKTKNVPQLVSYFNSYTKENENELKLILIGSGEIELPDNERIIDLGFISEEDKYDAYSAAAIYCHPSLNESFSIVLMEAWYLETPVLVDARCSVTKQHCLNSNGGLFYNGYYEFSECVNYIINNPEIAESMAKNGQKYVLENYQWEGLISRFFNFIIEGEDAV